jgi:predicted DCC family thiol-disulfide oxidoreductase YuxK
LAQEVGALLAGGNLLQRTLPKNPEVPGKTMTELRIFYDGQCPLCTLEINHLRRLDQSGRLDLQDIHQPDFEQRFPHIDRAAADQLLHGELPGGQLIFGLDTTCLAWQIVGKGHWFAFLRWPLIKPLADIGYRVFARYRHPISKMFGRPAVCDERCPKP